RLTQSHTGQYLAEHLVDCLKEYGISKKLHGVTVDNAESNTTMPKAVGQLIPGYRGLALRIRCF
ncbi:hypothetical protein K466DRAFT_448656, partial [Polyporus arcularius HHB13444]